jgi:small-conductance mechanosensitive channel
LSIRSWIDKGGWAVGGLALVAAMSGALAAQRPAPPKAVAGADSARGQRARGAPALPVSSSADTAALVVQNRTVFVFRSSMGARTAHDRMDDAARRIATVAERGIADSVVVRPIREGILLAAGERGVFTITPADLDSTAGETLDGLAGRVAQRLTTVLAAERDQRSLLHTLKAVGLALLATLAFLIVARLLAHGRRLTLARIPRAASPRMPALAVGGFTLLGAEQILAFARRLTDLLTWGLGLVAAYLWLTYVLTRFPYSAPWGEALGGYLVTTIRQFALGALGAIPGLFTVVLIFFATRFIARLVGTFFKAVESGDVSLQWLHPDTAQPTRRLLTGLLWLFAIVIAYPYLPGSGSDVFKGVSVFLGLMLSLGSSGLVNQAMSGLVLMYARVLKPGEYVRINEIEGTVTELGLLSTKIRTTKHEEVTVPNAVLAGTTTKNYSRLAANGGVILYTSVTIGYDTPWRQVHAMLTMAVERTTGLRREPAPFVLQQALSDFYVEYQLNAVLERPETRIAVLSALHANIQDCFNEFGVQIMSPHYKRDPDKAKIVSPADWHQAPAARPATLPAAQPRPASDAIVEGNGDDDDTPSTWPQKPLPI